MKSNIVYFSVFCFKIHFHLIHYLAIFFTLAHSCTIFVSMLLLYVNAYQIWHLCKIYKCMDDVFPVTAQQQLSLSLVTYGDEHSTRTRSVSRRKSLPNSIYRTFFFFLLHCTRTRTHTTVSHFPLSLSSSFAISLWWNTSFRDDGRFILDGGSRRIRISAGKKVFEVLTPRRVHCCRLEY